MSGESRAALEAERDAVLARLGALNADNDALLGSQVSRERASDPAGGDGDQASVERGAIRNMVAALGQRLADIDKALAEVGTDSYGLCTGCGSQIPVERLEALPGVATCVVCA